MAPEVDRNVAEANRNIAFGIIAGAGMTAGLLTITGMSHVEAMIMVGLYGLAGFGWFSVVDSAPEGGLRG